MREIPTYTYECVNGHRLEEFQPITAPTTRPCPECGVSENAVEMQRVFVPGAGVIWKGNRPAGNSPTPRFHRRG